MDVVLGIAFIAAIVAGALFFARWSNNKRKAEIWAGTVEDKKVKNIYDADGDKTGVSYNLTIRQGDGKKKKLSVTKSTFDALNVGDAVEKRAGEMDPVKAAA